MKSKRPFPIRKRIGIALRRHRETTGLSQEAFAERVGMHRTYYSLIERGCNDVQINTLERVCRTLDVRMSVIMRIAEDLADPSGD